MTSSKKTGGEDILLSVIQDVTKSVDSDDVGIFVGKESIDIVEEWIPSTNMSINYACGDPRYGAFPVGKIIEIYGPKSSAKSLIMYDAGAQVQKLGGIFVLIDTESAFHRGFGTHLGIDYNRFIYAHIRTMEEVFDRIFKIIEKTRKKTSAPLLIGWDSLAAATTLRELDEDFEDSKSEMGERARIMSKALRVLEGMLFEEDTTFMVANQIRKKLGIRFGKTETTPGGEALPFFAAQRVEVRRSKKIYKRVSGQKRTVGHNVSVYIEKNKVRPPFAQTNINVYVDRASMRYGLDRWSGLAELLASDGIIRMGKRGSCSLVADESVKFNKKEIGKYWDSILEVIPKDLYKAPIISEDNEDEEEEEDDE